MSSKLIVITIAIISKVIKSKVSISTVVLSSLLIGPNRNRFVVKIRVLI